MNLSIIDKQGSHSGLKVYLFLKVCIFFEVKINYFRNIIKNATFPKRDNLTLQTRFHQRAWVLMIGVYKRVLGVCQGCEAVTFLYVERSIATKTKKSLG
jgi:hypothetical protein